MSAIKRRPVFGSPTETKHGRVIFGVYFDSNTQASLMKTILEKAMVEYAGRDEETLLASWYNEISSQLGKAERQNWIGWKR